MRNPQSPFIIVMKENNMRKEYCVCAKKYILSDKKSFILGILFASLKSIFSLLVPLTFSAIMDQALPNREFKQLLLYSCLMVLGYMTMCCSGIGKDYFLSKVNESYIKLSRTLLLNKINKIKYSRLEEIDNGQIMAKYHKEIESIQEHFGDQFTSIIPNILVLIYCSIFIFSTSKIVFFSSLFMIGIYMTVNRYFGKKISIYAEENMKSNSEAISVFSDLFTNVFLTKIFSLYEKVDNRFKAIYDKYFRSSIKLKLLISMNVNFCMIVLYLSSGIMWFVCGNEIVKGNMSIGQLTVIISYQGMLLTPLSFFSEYNSSLKNTIIAIERIDKFLAIEEESYSGKKLDSIDEIVFENVSYGYDKEIILQGINLELKKGRIWGIVGPSGCGKSTIAKLLLRLYSCSEGIIKCNGIDIESYDLDDYRAKFSIMSQEPLFYEETVWENMETDANCTKYNIVEVSKNLDVYNDIIQFENGFDTILSKNAGNISGGQKKRLDALRAIIKKADVLIFDEGTNGLDKKRKKRIY